MTTLYVTPMSFELVARYASTYVYVSFFFFQAEDGIRDLTVTGVQTCALPISPITASSSSTLTLEVSTSYRPSRTAQLTPSRASHGTVPVARTKAGCTWCTRSSRRTKATTPTFTSAILTMTARLGARAHG